MRYHQSGQLADFLRHPRKVVFYLYVSASALFLLAFCRITFMSRGEPDWLALSTYGASLAAAASSNVTRDVRHPHTSGSAARWPMQLYMELAEIRWAKSVKMRHEVMTKSFSKGVEIPIFPATDSATYEETPFTVWDLTPATYTCPHEMQRVGPLGGGGRWVCGMSRYEEMARVQARPCIVYVFGVWDEWVFEKDLLARAECDIWAYDTVDRNVTELLDDWMRDRVHFKLAGVLGHSKSWSNPPLESVVDLMQANGHDYIDIMKLDVEHYEFEAMDAFAHNFPASEKKQLPLGQLLVDFHLTDIRKGREYLELFEKLEAVGLRPTWAEADLVAVTMNTQDHEPYVSRFTMVNANDDKSVVFNNVGPMVEEQVFFG